MVVEEEPADEMEAILRFQSLLDEEVESDFQLVSSTKQRLDLFLTSMEEDDVLVVSNPARLGLVEETTEQQQQQQHKSFCERQFFGPLSALLFGMLAIIFFHSRFISGRKNKTIRSIQRKDKVKSTSFAAADDEMDSNLVNTAGNATMALSGNTKRREEIQLAVADSTSMLTQEDAMTRLSASDISFSNKSKELLETPDDTTIVSKSSRSFDSSKDFLMQSITTDIVDDSDRMKIQLASKLAKDIKIMEKVLLEEGLDKELAQQLAVGMQTSSALMESQRQIASQRILVDAHQRSLDRQLSQRQHKETIQAAKYDTNWSDKLDKKRDLCWKAATRILFEVTTAFHLVKVIKPFLDVYYWTESNLSMPQVMKLAVHSLCDCEVSTNDVSTSSAPTYFFFIGYQVVDVFQFFGLESMMMLDSGICYGYCMLSFACILVATAILHQGLRVLSAPSLLHHVVNVGAITLYYGGSHLLQNPPSALLVVVSDANFLVLGALLLWLFAFVQWNYLKCRKSLIRTETLSMSKFQETFASSMERMESMHFQLSMLRYAMVAIYCSVLFATNTETKAVDGASWDAAFVL